MMIEERLEKLEKELAGAKRINRWKLIVVALMASLLCMVAKEGFFVMPARAQSVGLPVEQQLYFVTGDQSATLWKIGTDGELHYINRAASPGSTDGKGRSLYKPLP